MNYRSPNPVWEQKIPGGGSLEVLSVLEPDGITRKRRLFVVAIRVPDGRLLRVGNLGENLKFLPGKIPPGRICKPNGMTASRVEQAIRELKRWVIVRTTMKE